MYIDTAGTFLSSAVLSLPAPAGLDGTEQVLVARVANVGIGTLFELVGLASFAGGALTYDPDALGLPWPGIVGAGRYYFLVSQSPLAFATGQMLNNGASAESGLVTTGGPELVSLTEVTDPRYVLALDIGDADVFGTELNSGASAQASVQTENAGEVVVQDLLLDASQPSVAALTPEGGAVAVPPSAAVSVRFSRAMDGGSINLDSMQLLLGGVAVDGSVFLQPDGVSAVFQPTLPMASETLYTLRLSPNIQDTFGSALAGNQPDGTYQSTFTTADITPPPRPEPGLINMGLPENGVVTITGSLGSAEPGAIVTVFNQTTGTSSTVIANADGSFEIRILSSIYEDIVVRLSDGAGNETVFSPGIFNAGGGNVVVGDAGGTVTLDDGSQFTFAPGSFDVPVELSITRFDESESPIPTPTDFGLEFAGGFTIKGGDAELLRPLKFSLPANTVYPDDAVFLVCTMEEALGEEHLMILDTAYYADNRIIVNSPPWPGLLGIMTAPGKHFMMFLVGGQNISFVKGKVVQRPPVGVLTLDVPLQVSSIGDPPPSYTISAAATPIAPGTKVTKLEVMRGDGTVLASSAGGSAGETVLVFATDHLDLTLNEQVGSAIGYALIGEFRYKWKAKVTFEFSNGETQDAETVAAARTPTSLPAMMHTRPRRDSSTR